MNELEINFSKYDQSTGAYYTYKRNEKQGQPSVVKTSQESQNKTADNSESIEAAVKTLKKDADPKITKKIVKS